MGRTKRVGQNLALRNKQLKQYHLTYHSNPFLTKLDLRGKHTVMCIKLMHVTEFKLFSLIQPRWLIDSFCGNFPTCKKKKSRITNSKCQAECQSCDWTNTQRFSSAASVCAHRLQHVKPYQKHHSIQCVQHNNSNTAQTTKIKCQTIEE